MSSSTVAMDASAFGLGGMAGPRGPGMPPQGGYGIQPYGAPAPAPAENGKTGLIIGIVVFMVLAVGAFIAVFLRSR